MPRASRSAPKGEDPKSPEKSAPAPASSTVSLTREAARDIQETLDQIQALLPPRASSSPSPTPSAKPKSDQDAAVDARAAFYLGRAYARITWWYEAAEEWIKAGDECPKHLLRLAGDRNLWQENYRVAAAAYAAIRDRRRLLRMGDLVVAKSKKAPNDDHWDLREWARDAFEHAARLELEDEARRSARSGSRAGTRKKTRS